MDEIEQDRMEELYLYRKRLVARLESIVQDLSSAAAAGSNDDWKSTQPDDPQTPHWKLVHLRNIERQALAPRLKRILNEDDPHLVLFDDEKWMESHYRADEPVEVIIADYEKIRKEELSWLKEMNVKAWSRTCRHPWFGVRTFQWWVEKTMAYAEEHLEEIKSGLDH